VLDPKGGLLTKKAGVLSVASLEELVATGTKIRTAFLDLKKKAAAGDAVAKQYFELRELELGHVTYANYRTRNPDLMKLSEDVRESVQMVAGEIVLRQALQTIRAAGRDEAKANAALLVAGEALLAAAKEGAEPFDDQQRVSFYYYMGVAGDKHDRADMLDAAIEGLADDAEDNKRIAEALGKWKSKSADLKAKKAQ